MRLDDREPRAESRLPLVCLFVAYSEDKLDSKETLMRHGTGWEELIDWGSADVEMSHVGVMARISTISMGATPGRKAW